MNRSRMIVLVIFGASLAGCSARPIEAIPGKAAEPGTTLLLIDVSAGDNRFQVFGYGGPPCILGLDLVFGDGLSVCLTNRRRGTVYERDWGEATFGCIIDYSSGAAGVFRFTDCTTDYRPYDCLLSLVETTVTVHPDGTCDISRRVALKGEKADSELAARLVQSALAALDSQGDRREQEFMEVLLRLRNMGVDDPDMALESMKALSKKSDGALSESVSQFMGEVELIKQAYAQR